MVYSKFLSLETLKSIMLELKQNHDFVFKRLVLLLQNLVHINYSEVSSLDVLINLLSPISRNLLILDFIRRRVEKLTVLLLEVFSLDSFVSCCERRICVRLLVQKGGRVVWLMPLTASFRSSEHLVQDIYVEQLSESYMSYCIVRFCFRSAELQMNR